MKPDQDAIDHWRDSTPMWLKHNAIIRQMLAPVTAPLLEDALVAQGQTVLDIATGSGEPALTIAGLVGPEGKVFGIDPVPEMIDAARRAAQRDGFPNAHFEVATAGQLPFPDDTFDAAVNRFGIMFVPSPTDAVREMLRVLKPGRKLALAVWHFVEKNPYSWILSRAINRRLNSPPPEPDAPEQFRFATPGKLLQIARDAGAQKSSERLVRFIIEASVTAERFLDIRLEMNDKIGMLSAEQVSAVRREALGDLRQYEKNGHVEFPAEILIVSGSKGVSA